MEYALSMSMSVCVQAPRSNYKDSDQGGPSQNRSPRPRDNSAEYESFQVTWGSQQGADARRLLALVCRRGGVRGHSVGAIRISDRSSMVQVKKSEASAFERAASRPDPRDPQIKIRPWLEPNKRGGGIGSSKSPKCFSGGKVSPKETGFGVGSRRSENAGAGKKRTEKGFGGHKGPKGAGKPRSNKAAPWSQPQT